MPKATSHIPPGLASLIAQVVIKDARGFLAFVETAFGGKAGNILPTPDGKGILHAHTIVEGTALFVAEPFGQAAPTRTNLMLYVKDVDETVRRATKAGAKVMVPPADQAWGDRWSMISDPWGNEWQIASHVEDVAPDEMMRRMAAQQPR